MQGKLNQKHVRGCGLKREVQRVTKVKEPDAAMATGIWSQESENRGAESKNSRSRVKRMGLEQVLLVSHSGGPAGHGGYGAAEFKGPGLCLGASDNSQGWV